MHLGRKIEGRKLIQWSLGVVGIAIIIGYSFFVLEGFARGPRLLIASPENGFSTTTPVITIVGQAIHTNNLVINDNPTPVDLEGNFDTQLILAPGYNIIKVAAKDAYARTVEKTIEINLLSTQEKVATTTASTTMESMTSSSTATSTIN